MDYLDQALRGLLIGILIALIVFYVLRPHEPYPRWVMVPFDQPWMLVILAAVVVFVFFWDQRVALLMVIFVLGVGMDVNVYGKTYVQTSLRSEPSATSVTESTGGYPAADPSGTQVDAEPLASFPGDPLSASVMPQTFTIDLPHYPLVTQVYTNEPGSPAPFA